MGSCGGSATDFDYYIVITGLAGDDFVYDDAALATEYGRNLLISASEPERAWWDSSNPRHVAAFGSGGRLDPLPTVSPRAPDPTAAVTAGAGRTLGAPARCPIRPPALERVRDQMLERMGAPPAIVGPR